MNPFTGILQVPYNTYKRQKIRNKRGKEEGRMDGWERREEERQP